MWFKINFFSRFYLELFFFSMLCHLKIFFSYCWCYCCCCFSSFQNLSSFPFIVLDYNKMIFHFFYISYLFLFVLCLQLFDIQRMYVRMCMCVYMFSLLLDLFVRVCNYMCAFLGLNSFFYMSTCVAVYETRQ